MTKEDIKKMLELKHQGLTIQQVADSMQMKTRKIEYWLKKAREAGYETPKARTGRQPLDLTGIKI
jgi:orotate phosphoribosyltransferase-like protein